MTRRKLRMKTSSSPPSAVEINRLLYTASLIDRGLLESLEAEQTYGEQLARESRDDHGEEEEFDF